MSIKDFINQTWVKVIAWVMVGIGALILLLDGISVGDINQVVELIFGIIQAIGLLIVAIAKLLQKKATTNK